MLYTCFSITFSLSFTVKPLFALPLRGPRFSKKYTAVFYLVVLRKFTMVVMGFTHSEKLFLVPVRSTVLQLSEIIIFLFTSTNVLHAILNKTSTKLSTGKTNDKSYDFESIFGSKIARRNF